MYIQTSARLKNGSWEVHTGVSGRKMPEQSNLAGCSFTLAWDHFSFKILPHTPSFCKSCRWDGLLVLDLLISCLTWPFIKLLQQGAKRRRGLIIRSYYLSDQNWGNGGDCRKNSEGRNNYCHLNDASMLLILRDGAFLINKSLPDLQCAILFNLH